MAKVLIVYHSDSGNTARLADAIAEGARSVEFAEVEVRRLESAESAAVAGSAEGRHRVLEGVEMLLAHDALVLGAPSRHGGMSAELKQVLDATADWWKENRLMDRVGSAFTTTGTPHGGHETTLWAIMTAMANLGMILVPPGYTDPVMMRGGSPYGATATTAGEMTEADLDAARHQGRRVAQVAEWIRHARSHEHAHRDAHPHHHHH